MSTWSTLSNNKYVSVIPPCVSGYSTKCIGSVKDSPDEESRFQLYLLDNGKITIKASNGLYLSRIAYSNDPVNQFNYIQPAKDTPDHLSQLELYSNTRYLGTIALNADNGCYVAREPSGGMIIKPLAINPHPFLLIQFVP